MAERKIVLTPRAEEDLRSIFNYLLDASFHAADAQTDLILDRIEQLKTFPRLGKVVSDYENERLRELVIGNYHVAYYIVSDEKIDVLAIHHASSPGRR